MVRHCREAAGRRVGGVSLEGQGVEGSHPVGPPGGTRGPPIKTQRIKWNIFSYKTHITVYIL